MTLTKLLLLNIELKTLLLKRSDKLDGQEISYTEIKKTLPIKRISKLTDIIKKWLEIQDCVTCFFDTSKAAKAADREGTGIKQILEKKEGLFRMKMMGKR